jgi:hypothetical protein
MPRLDALQIKIGTNLSVLFSMKNSHVSRISLFCSTGVYIYEELVSLDWLTVSIA